MFGNISKHKIKEIKTNLNLADKENITTTF